MVTAICSSRSATWAGPRAQDLSDTAGSIVRIKTNGTVPEDNPFVATPGAQSEIWSYGHRDPQGLAFDRATGQLWSDEHGPQGGDELNLVRPAAITAGPSPPSASIIRAIRSR